MMDGLSITQPDGAHRVTVVQDGLGYLVSCHECARLFRAYFSGGYKTLVRGDWTANHSFGVGLAVQGVTVQTEDDLEIARLLDDVDIDVSDL